MYVGQLFHNRIIYQYRKIVVGWFERKCMRVTNQYLILGKFLRQVFNSKYEICNSFLRITINVCVGEFKLASFKHNIFENVILWYIKSQRCSYLIRYKLWANNSFFVISSKKQVIFQ